MLAFLERVYVFPVLFITEILMLQLHAHSADRKECVSLLTPFLCSLLQRGARGVSAGGKRLGEAGEQSRDEMQSQGWGQKLRRAAKKLEGVMEEGRAPGSCTWPRWGRRKCAVQGGEGAPSTTSRVVLHLLMGQLPCLVFILPLS